MRGEYAAGCRCSQPYLSILRAFGHGGAQLTELQRDTRDEQPGADGNYSDDGEKNYKVRELVFEMRSRTNPDDGCVQENRAENSGEQEEQEIRRIAGERDHTQ